MKTDTHKTISLGLAGKLKFPCNILCPDTVKLLTIRVDTPILVPEYIIKKFKAIIKRQNISRAECSFQCRNK